MISVILYGCVSFFTHDYPAGFIYPSKYRNNEDGKDYVKVFYIADDRITVFIGVSVMNNDEINDKVNCMYIDVMIEDMVHSVKPGDNVADILAYRH